MLKIHELPLTGGDTLWASGYEIYDRLSPAMQKFLEGLTATHDASFFLDEARRLGNPLREGQRGSPLNVGAGLKAEHPVIRTNRKFAQLNRPASGLNPPATRMLMKSNSGDGLEVGLCQQGVYQAHQRGDQR